MKEMSLQDVQSASLAILKNFHAFCVSHNIKYSLGYGSLIGAIRHKGFIPWDDDIDVVMMREDFERFCNEYVDTTKYKLFSYSRNNTFSVVARLCEMEKTYVNTATPLFIEKTGVWIDIFPLDSVDENKQNYEKVVANIEEINQQIFHCRWQMRRLDLKDIYKIRTFLSWLKNVRKARSSINEILSKHNDLCIAYAGNESSVMSMLAFPAYLDRGFFPKRVFTDVENVLFEKEYFKAMKGYDEWLRIIYGDYMIVPPMEKQQRRHSIHKYFWKD